MPSHYRRRNDPFESRGDRLVGAIENILGSAQPFFAREQDRLRSQQAQEVDDFFRERADMRATAAGLRNQERLGLETRRTATGEQNADTAELRATQPGKVGSMRQRISEADARGDTAEVSRLIKLDQSIGRRDDEPGLTLIQQDTAIRRVFGQQKDDILKLADSSYLQSLTEKEIEDKPLSVGSRSELALLAKQQSLKGDDNYARLLDAYDNIGSVEHRRAFIADDSLGVYRSELDQGDQVPSFPEQFDVPLGEVSPATLEALEDLMETLRNNPTGTFRKVDILNQDPTIDIGFLESQGIRFSE